MKILVTGGSGFVGGALCAQTIARGWETVAISRRISNHGRSIPIDLSRPFTLDFNPDVVVHAAARSSPWGKRSEFDAQNIEATRNVIAFCERHGTPHLVYVSTSAVLYEKRHQYDLTEESRPPAHFINEYARTKFAGEELVRRYPGLQTIVRPRAVFGPGDTVVFPRILRAAREGKFPLIESDETVMADLIYIDTLVDYILRAIDRRVTGLYHLTNHHPVALVAFLRDIFSRLGLPAPTRKLRASRAILAAQLVEGVHRLLPFLGEPPITTFGISVFAYSKTMDASKSRRDLGLPSVSLEEGVDRFLAWQRTQPSQLD
jgi:nucleoside-diphosphate-sugar epimerase